MRALAFALLLGLSWIGTALAQQDPSYYTDRAYEARRNHGDRPFAGPADAQGTFATPDQRSERQKARDRRIIQRQQERQSAIQAPWEAWLRGGR